MTFQIFLLLAADKKEKDSSKPSKDKDSKDSKRSSAPGDKLIERKLAAEKSGSGRPGSAGAAAAPAKQPKARGAQAAAAAAAGSKGGASSYLADYDLPSSESESEDEVERRRGMLGSDEEGPAIKEVSAPELLWNWGWVGWKKGTGLGLARCLG
mgnify:CR=1 FL=1